MKNSFINRITALLLCAVMLFTAGCGSTERFGRAGGSIPDGVKFSDMEYIRPDLDELYSTVAAINDALSNKDTKAVKTLVLHFKDIIDGYYSMYTIAEIRNSLDLTDEFYAAEYEWLDSNDMVLSQQANLIAEAVKESKVAKKIQRQDYWQEFEYYYTDENEYTDEVLSLFEREAELLAQYRELLASPTISIDGTEYDFEAYIAAAEDYDSYASGLAAYYDTYNVPMAKIYTSLISVRKQIAAELGYDSYKQMQFEVYGRDYTPEDEENFIALTQKYFVPLCTEMSETLSEDYLYAAADIKLCYECVDSMVKAIGGNIKTAFDYMKKYELFDIEPAEAKLPGAFTAFIYGYDEPFLMMNPEGCARDIFSFAHEFGHYTDYYWNDSTFESLDVAECFSVSMELIMTEYLSETLTNESSDILSEAEIYSTMNNCVVQASFAEFENRVYACDTEELTPERLGEIFLDVQRDFGTCTEFAEQMRGMGWIDINHFVEVPFYVLSYAVSSAVALQVYAAEAENEGAGLEIYRKMLKRDSDTIVEFVKECGLDDPFSEENMKNNADFLRICLS